FLWFAAPSCTGMTNAIKYATTGKPVYARKPGQLTPGIFYAGCYLHRGEPVILDDSEELLDYPLGAKLISALGDTTPIKHLSWDIRSRLPPNIPSTFSTSSGLCILANRSTVHRAIQSRAIILYF